MAKKLLIVDDNLALCQSLCDVLGAKGYEVKSVGVTDDIWDTIKRDFFDLMILDLIMPDKNTITILGGLKSMCPNTRIVIYSGYEEYEKSPYIRIADAFLSKSKGLNPLLSVIEKLIG